MEYFHDKCVLLTGGSSGIGLAAARMLREMGAHLILVARDEEKLDKAATELEQVTSEGKELHILPLDVSDADAVKAAMDKLPGDRPVQILINNAGITRPGNFLELPEETFEQMMQVNYMGSVHLTRLLVPAMVEAKGGHVAFVSSLLGLMGIWGYTAYAASKFAQRGFAECLRCELKPHDVRVSVCYPPDTDTPQHEWEQQYLPEETRAIAGNAKTLSAECVATALLKGMAAGKFSIVPGASSKFADVMYRWFPSMVQSMFDGDARKAKKS